MKVKERASALFLFSDGLVPPMGGPVDIRQPVDDCQRYALDGWPGRPLQTSQGPDSPE